MTQLQLVFNPLRLLLALLLLAAVPGGGPAPALAAPRAAEAKISPWVLAQTEGGQAAEFLVVLAEQANLSAAATLADKQTRGRYVYQTLWETAQASQGPLLRWLQERGVEHRPYYIVNLVWVKGDAEVARALAARPDVARLAANPAIENAGSAISAPQASEPATAAWLSPSGVEANISYVRAPEVWAMGFTGQGIVIGAQDTGFDWEHPALQGQYRGWNGSSADHDYNWHDSIHTAEPACGADSPEPCDDLGHGTHVLGTALGEDGSNQIGVAPGAQWIGCRNMRQGVGTPATYLECFEFFLAPYPIGSTPAEGNPDLAPDVTVNSWSCTITEGCTLDDINILRSAVEAQRAAGIMTVTSAGNYGYAGCSSVNEPPAIYEAAYAVGALNTGSDAVAPFSSRGPVDEDGSNRLKPDITAPGTNIRSSVPGGGYAPNQGTSMAAPHVAGAVALLWSAVPALRGAVTETIQVLNESAFDISTSLCEGDSWPNNTYGYGRLDARGALDLVTALYGGTLTGTITDVKTGAPVSGAALTLSRPGPSYTATTDFVGHFHLTALVGSYTLSVTAPGFLPVTVSDIQITGGVTSTQDLALSPPLLLYFPILLHSSAAGAAVRPNMLPLDWR